LQINKQQQLDIMWSLSAVSVVLVQPQSVSHKE